MYIYDLQRDFLNPQHLFIDGRGNTRLVRDVLISNLGVEVGDKPTNSGSFNKMKQLVCNIIRLETKGCG